MLNSQVGLLLETEGLLSLKVGEGSVPPCDTVNLSWAGVNGPEGQDGPLPLVPVSWN